MATKKNTRSRSLRRRVRTAESAEMAFMEKQLRILSEIAATVPKDDPDAMKAAVQRWCLNRVLEAVAESGNDEDLMRKAAPALEALSDGPLSDTARTFLDQICSHLPNPDPLV